MKKVRTLGRRMWETRLPIRFAGFTAICMLSVSVWFLWASVERLQEPHSPHFGNNHCYDCHQGTTDHEGHQDCYGCHDKLSRNLLPGAREKKAKLSPSPECMHDLKGERTLGRRTVTSLCIMCHKKITGYVSMVDIATGKYVEVDMARSHPIGLMPTATIFPRTLPLSRETGSINCTTCHDPHAVDRRLRMLRYYYPGNGHPADFRPLCLDCHTEGWLPLRMRPSTVQEAEKRS